MKNVAIAPTGQPLSNTKREKFCWEYLSDLNAAQAAIRAGYSAKTAKEIAYQLLRDPSVAARVSELQAKIMERLEITAERVVREAARLAFSDLRKFFNADGSLKPIIELDDDTAASLASFESVERAVPGGEGTTEVVRKIKAWDKPAALTLLGRHFNLFTEKFDIGDNLATALDRARERRQARLS